MCTFSYKCFYIYRYVSNFDIYIYIYILGHIRILNTIDVTLRYTATIYIYIHILVLLHLVMMSDIFLLIFMIFKEKSIGMRYGK